MVEIPKGKRIATLAVPSGRYLVRKIVRNAHFGKEIVVKPDDVQRVHEDELVRLEGHWRATRGLKPVRPEIRTVLPSGTKLLRFAFGAEEQLLGGPGGTGSKRFAYDVGFDVGFSDRLTWHFPLPAFSLQVDTHDRNDWVVFGGWDGVETLDATPTAVSGNQVVYDTTKNGLTLGLVAGAAFRRWLPPGKSDSDYRSWLLSLRVVGNLMVRGAKPSLGHTVVARATTGYSLTFRDKITLNFGVGYTHALLAAGLYPGSLGPELRAGFLMFGGVAERGLLPLPLMQFHLGRVVTLNFNAEFFWWPGNRSFGDRYTAGMWFAW